MSEASKFDKGKSPIGLIPRSALIAEADVLAFGAQKYDRHNWRRGMDWSRLVDAAMRHLTAWNEGEDVDPETGITHLAHAKCCLSFLIEYQAAGLGHDDRFHRYVTENVTTAVEPHSYHEEEAIEAAVNHARTQWEKDAEVLTVAQPWLRDSTERGV